MKRANGTKNKFLRTVMGSFSRYHTFKVTSTSYVGMLIENANIFRLTIYRTFFNASFAPGIYILIYTARFHREMKGTTPFKHVGPVV